MARYVNPAFSQSSRVRMFLASKRTGFGRMDRRRNANGALRNLLWFVAMRTMSAPETDSSIERAVTDEVREVCRFFRLDPLYALGQGSLVIASRPDHSNDIAKALRRRGIHSRIIGKLGKGKNHIVEGPNGIRRPLQYPKEDPYWRAYWNATRRGWS